jgi:HipA-like C-terminal domain
MCIVAGTLSRNSGTAQQAVCADFAVTWLPLSRYSGRKSASASSGVRTPFSFVANRADIEELWRRIAYSILITNVDDHLQNLGFLHVERGLWRLAPAFDINPFPDRVRELKTWVSPEAGPEATIEALMSVVAYCPIERRRRRP